MYATSTQTFKHLISKYHKKLRERNNNAKKNLLKNIENNLQRLENEEHEGEFIVREVRRDVELKRKILFSFGTKALKHYDQTQKLKIKTKINKNKLFTELTTNEDYILDTPDNSRNRRSNLKYITGKYIHFPKISDLNANKNKNKSIYDSITILKKYEKSLETSDGKSSVERKKNSDIPLDEKYLFTERNKRDIKKLNYFNTFSNITTIKNKDSSKKLLPNLNTTPEKTERNSTNYKKIDNRTTKRHPFKITQDYINYLQNIKTKSVLEEKRKKKFFDTNKYGCDEFKLKYDYLNQKYFDYE